MSAAIESAADGAHNTMSMTVGARPGVEKALEWVRNHRVAGGGIAVHHQVQTATQEVTGYLIPTLLQAGQAALAVELACWEASVQQPDGSHAAPDGVPYTFDTAQVIRGYLAVLDIVPALETNLRRACHYVAQHIDADGRVHSPSLEMWKLADGSVLTDYCNLYVLPPLLAAGRHLGEPAFVDAATRGLRYFLRKSDLVIYKRQPGTFSHMFGYMMEALVDMGEHDLAAKGLAQAAAIQQEDGSIPAYPGATWTCTTGMAQLAIAWFKLGQRDVALRTLAALERLQRPSGGFFGSHGDRAIYFTAEEISWAVKFFLDAERLAAQPEPASTSPRA